MKQTAVFVLGILILIGQVFCARNVSKATQFGEDYVFNGMKVGRISEYPWVAFFKGLGCTGAVISKKFILTAAHCFKDKENDKNTEIIIGQLDETGGIRDIQRCRINKIIVEKFDQKTKENDIALVKVEDNIANSKNIQVSLPNAVVNLNSGQTLAVDYAGWGATTTFIDVFKKYFPSEYKALKDKQILKSSWEAAKKTKDLDNLKPFKENFTAIMQTLYPNLGNIEVMLNAGKVPEKNKESTIKKLLKGGRERNEKKTVVKGVGAVVDLIEAGENRNGLGKFWTFVDNMLDDSSPVLFAVKSAYLSRAQGEYKRPAACNSEIPPNVDTLTCVDSGDDHGFCRGDSGGPVTFRSQEYGAILLGVVSYSKTNTLEFPEYCSCNCYNPTRVSGRVVKYLDIVTRVDKFKQWIKAKTKPFIGTSDVKFVPVEIN